MPIEIESSDIDVTNTNEAEIEIGSVEAETINISNATVEPQVFTVCNDDIYIVERNASMPQWFSDILDNQILDSGLANDVTDLSNKFDNFADGTTLQIGYLQSADEKIAYDLSVLKVSQDGNTAGIQELNQTRITATDATAISEATIGAWQTGLGAAWFNEKISTVSNVAYSAAKSASTLTASIISQQDQLDAIVGDISILEKQVDGVVETWFGLDSPIDGSGDIIPTVEPYATWVANNEIPIHTGDTYVHYELDVNGNKSILATYKFTLDTANGSYNWNIFTDDLASTAYQAALNAQSTADSKIVTWYQSSPPSFATQEEKDNAYGDIWIDSDNNNKMYRYTNEVWTSVSDQRIDASVDRLDEATVDINGNARAKSSLSVNANGAIAGYVAEAGTTSSFKILADKFEIAKSDGATAGSPFEIDLNTQQIKFTANVTFAGTPVENAITPITVEEAIANNVTNIDGSKITTGQLSANRIYGGVMYNVGGNFNSYKMKIDLNNGYIHIR